MIPRKIIYTICVCTTILLGACKAKGRIDPLDTNSFDSVAVGEPLEVDTALAGVTDTDVDEPSPYDKADSIATKRTDSLVKP